MAMHGGRTIRRENNENQVIVVLLLLVIVAAYFGRAIIPIRTMLIGGTLGLSLLLVLIRRSQQFRQQRLREQLLLSDITSLSPTDFELSVQRLLRDLGWQHVEHVGGSGDGGVDLRARFAGQRYIIQCKRFKGIVLPTHIRDLYGTLTHEKADRALLVTTGHTNQNTYNWIADKPINIWDGDQLAQYARQAEVLRQTPAQTAGKRRATLWFCSALAALNLIVILFVMRLPEDVVPKYLVQPEQQTSDIAMNVIFQDAPSATLPAPPTATLIATASTTEVPLLAARVSHGGNLRAQPSLQGQVLDQLHAQETVTLLAQTSDGVWYQVSNARNIVGWAHNTLLDLDQSVMPQVPTITPQS